MAPPMPVAVPGVSTPGGQAPALLTLLERRFRGVRVDLHGWTPDAVQALRDMWAEGVPTRAIGRVLGCGNNAVVGKAHRLKLEGRVNPVTQLAAARPPRGTKRLSYAAPAQARPAQPRPAVAPAALTTTPAEPPEPATQFRRREAGECCWPLWGMQERGTPGYGRFCCAPAPGGQAYCPEHRAIGTVRRQVAA